MSNKTELGSKLIRCECKSLSTLHTIILLLLTVGVFELTNIDLWTQEFFYFRSTQTWLIDSNNTVLRFIFYSGIKTLFIAVVLSLIFALIFLRKAGWVKSRKKSLILIVLSCIVIPLVVGFIKDATNIPCPNQLLFFDGGYAQIGLFEVMGDNNTRPHTSCYPAGHASGGFALLSLLFLFNRPKSKRVAFVAVMLLAWGIASYKMLIGDHFLSHTLVTMLLAWLMILLLTILVEKFTRLR